ncbi:MAG: hypothetical protein KAY24_17880, partial [Candidatus Eisenbacteria sp.]|nr:hypothetical protein [Candidatus Eisenbacteria bacterium]
MNAHALRALEFERVRDLLAERAVSPPGQERARQLAPLTDQSRAEALLQGVDEVVSLRLRRTSWPDLRFADLRPTLDQGRLEGAVLQPEQLLDVARCLEVACQVSDLFCTDEQRERRPHLALLAERLVVEREFPRRIERAFDPSGEMQDDASPALRSIRSQLMHCRREASKQLERLSRGLGGSGEETLVTLRGGRYVLSVAVSERRRLQGIVH